MEVRYDTTKRWQASVHCKDCRSLLQYGPDDVIAGRGKPDTLFPEGLVWYGIKCPVCHEKNWFSYRRERLTPGHVLDAALKRLEQWEAAQPKPLSRWQRWCRAWAAFWTTLKERVQLQNSGLQPFPADPPRRCMYASATPESQCLNQATYRSQDGYREVCYWCTEHKGSSDVPV